MVVLVVVAFTEAGCVPSWGSGVVVRNVVNAGDGGGTVDGVPASTGLILRVARTVPTLPIRSIS